MGRPKGAKDKKPRARRGTKARRNAIDRIRKIDITEFEDYAPTKKRGPGRPKGSNSKRRGPGRPKGSKNKTTSTSGVKKNVYRKITGATVLILKK